MTTTTGARQVYQLYIKASPEQIWDAITKPEFTAQYFYGARITSTADGRSAQGPDGSDWGSGPVFEFEPPRRLVHEWRSAYDEEMGAEEPSRISWEIEPHQDGTCLLTVVHDQLEGAPKTAASVGGAGWMRVLSGLKTLVETGEALA
jgi:uncharacterized protein YndB with AHSA1/START domain